MMTGRPPFSGDSHVAVLAKILHDEPAPPSTLADIPPDVERTILRCLRKDPARRFQTMADLQIALEDHLTDSSALLQAAGRRLAAPRRRARGVVLAAVGLGVAAIAAAYIGWLSLRAPAPGEPLHAVPLTALPGVVRSPSFSPDGNHVTFAWSGPQQSNSDIYVQQIGAGTPLQLTTDAASDYSPAWSPDGRAIAFLRQAPNSPHHELRLVPPLGGPERKVVDIQPRGFLRAVTLAWCPDSKCVVLTDATSSDGTGPDALFVVSLESGAKRQLTTPPPEFHADNDPAISPDGRWLAFRRDVAPFSGRLLLVPLTEGVTPGGEPRSLTPILITAYNPKWISNGEIIFGAKSSLWRMGIAAGATPARLPFVGADGQMPAVAPPQNGRPGRLVYVRSFADANVWRLETSGAGKPLVAAPVVTISSSRREALVNLSDDGQKITFISDRAGESEVWMADATGGNAVQLTTLGANPGYPRWAPDGKRIVFHSNSEEHPYGAIHVVATESGGTRRLTANRSTDVFPSFSRDGRWIYFSSSRTGIPQIWKMPSAGGEPALVSSRAGMLAIESMDGASLFFVESRTSDAPGTLWRVPLDGAPASTLVDGVNSLSFAVVEEGVYYIERVGNVSRLRYFDLTTRQATIVATDLGVVTPGLTASRDGRVILFSRIDSSVNDLMLVENFR
jgi:Tol biopolymer transport system component